MHEAAPSRTALRVAIRRAAHQILDRPLVFADPLALRIIGPEHSANLETNRDNAASRSLRAWMAVRSRYAEDQLAKAINEGVEQYVVLGAGLDTFAYRNPHAGLRVFEVDHPATQQWKRKQLQAAGIEIPSEAMFVPVDFERQNLRTELEQGGLQMDRPAFFSWLGVVPYLTDRAFEETLEFIASMPQPSGVVFDYGVARSALKWTERLVLDALAARVAAAGEPFQLFFEPEQLAARLKGIGFPYVEDLGSAEITRRYFSGRTDGLELKGNLARLVTASRRSDNPEP